MATEKRNTHTYKCTDKMYNAAVKRAKKEKGYLSNLIEYVVTGYALGLEVKLHKSGNGKESALDIFSRKSDQQSPNYITVQSKPSPSKP